MSVRSSAMRARSVIGSNTGSARLLVRYLNALAIELTSLSQLEAKVAVRTVYDLLAEALRPAAPSSREARRTALRASVRRYIHDNLSDPRLSPPRIAAANAMSVRALHALFEETDESVAQTIRRERLRRAFDDLTDSLDDSVLDIALRWGFSDAAHFSRVFKREYGLSPSDVREGSQDRRERTMHRARIAKRSTPDEALLLRSSARHLARGTRQGTTCDRRHGSLSFDRRPDVVNRAAACRERAQKRSWLERPKSRLRKEPSVGHDRHGYASRSRNASPAKRASPRSRSPVENESSNRNGHWLPGKTVRLEHGNDTALIYAFEQDALTWDISGSVLPRKARARHRTTLSGLFRFDLLRRVRRRDRQYRSDARDRL